MILDWSPAALADRLRIIDYIAKDSISAALDIDEAIASQANLLLIFPEAGRPGRVHDTRE